MVEYSPWSFRDLLEDDLHGLAMANAEPILDL
jgi:hypothetical protein